jgi:hypothetical protein
MCKEGRLWLFLLCICFVLSCLAACTDDLSSSTTEEDNTAIIKFQITAETPQEVTTRSVNEDVIHDMYILVYNSAGDIIGMNYSTFDAVASSCSVTVKARSGKNCTIYAIANTNNPDIFNGDVVNTELKLKSLTSRIAAWGGLNSTSTETTYLPMCGSVITDINAGESTLSSGMTVTRMVARVDLDITVEEGSGITIDNYAICSLPASTYYVNRSLTTEGSVADNAGETGDDSGNPSTSDDWVTSGSIDAAGASEVKGFFYMYENRRGVNSTIASQNQKTQYNAPSDSATYVLINGEALGYKAVWRVYLGADNTTNFNIKRNYKYIYNIKLKCNEADSRVTVLNGVQSAASDGLSNCYIVPPGGSVNIPVRRANSAGTAQIRTSTSWTASVVWQTALGLVTLSNATGTGVRDALGADTYFTVMVPAGISPGNAVIKVVDNDDTSKALWSWHIWVTNYNPNVTDATYTANNGYRDYVFMDRNLGATRNDYDASDTGVCGLLYQWGRKDPFPGIPSWDTESYTNPDIAYYGDATTLSATPLTLDNSGIAYAIAHPDEFLAIRTGWMDAATSADSINSLYLWNSASSGGKTIYDPCPAGWRVPAYSETVNIPSNDNYSPWRYFDYVEYPSESSFTNWENSSYGGSKFYDGTTFRGWNFTHDGKSTYYPVTGYRAQTYGTLHENSEGEGFCWSASPSIGQSRSAYYLYLYADFVLPSNIGFRSCGYPVRCVKE